MRASIAARFADHRARRRAAAPALPDDVQHYQKLLAGLARVEVIEVREDEQVPKRVPERASRCLLAADGKTFDSEGFSGFLEQRRQAGLRSVLRDRRAAGLDLEHCDLRLSLGPMTLPHQLARVVLLEQLYRGHKILAGRALPLLSGLVPRPRHDPVAELAAPPSPGRRAALARRRPGRAARARAAAQARSSATTPPTRRCCSRPRWASRRAQIAERLGEVLSRAAGRGRRAGGRGRPGLPEPLHVRRLADRGSVADGARPRATRYGAGQRAGERDATWSS